MVWFGFGLGFSNVSFGGDFLFLLFLLLRLFLFFIFEREEQTEDRA